MTINTVTLTWDLTDLLKTGQQGTITLEPDVTLTDATDQLVIAEVPRSAQFSAGVGQLAGIIATDNSQISPSGWAYVITVAIDNEVVSGFPFTADIAFANGATQDLSTLAPLVPVPATLAYMPLPTGTAVAGDVPVATGTAETSAWETLTSAGIAALGTDGHVSSSQRPRPTLYAPTGLRRWRAAYGDALFTQIPIVCVGDSITAGQGGDNNATTFNNVPDNSNGWAGQLRALFAATLGAGAGEGFIFADDSRVTTTGTNSNWPCVPLRHGPRLLHGSGQTLTLTVPAGVTQLGIIQANETQAFNAAGSNLADVSGLYSQVGSATVTNANITTLTNTGLPVETDIACQSGDVITVSAPATAQTYIVGFNLKSGFPGVLVHRIGQPGFVSGDMLGGQSSGVLLQSGSSANQQTAERACYYWAGTTGLVIVGFGTNDQAYQAGGGTAAQNDVTLSLYTTWMEQFCNQAIADGWCCLIVGQPRSPNAASGTGIATEDQYFSAMQAYALATDHVAYMDVGELWGSVTASAALNLTNGSSVHPLRRGHGDIARMLWNALNATAGTTELVAA